MWLAKVTPTADVTLAQEITLEQLLIKLIDYGHPKLHHLQGGWYCKVDMNTNTVGAQFDIASEFGNATPLVAAKQCHERIVNALKELNK